MQHDHAIAAKEQMQKQRLYIMLGNTEAVKDKIDDGFRLGREDWKPHLNSMYPADEIIKFFATYASSIGGNRTFGHLMSPHAIAAKEQMQKQHLYVLFGSDDDLKNIVDEGFTLGAEDWEGHLGSMYPCRDVEAVFNVYPRPQKSSPEARPQ